MHCKLNLISPVANPLSTQGKLNQKSLKATKSKSIKDNTSFITSLSKQSVSDLSNNSIEAKLPVTQTKAKARKEIAHSRKQKELEETEVLQE